MAMYCYTLLNQNVGLAINHMTHRTISLWKCFFFFFSPHDKIVAADLQRQANGYMSNRMWHDRVLAQHAIPCSNKAQDWIDQKQLMKLHPGRRTLSFCILSRFSLFEKTLYLSFGRLIVPGCCSHPPLYCNQVHPLRQSNINPCCVIRYSAIKMMRFELSHNLISGAEPWEVQVAAHVINHGAEKSIRHVFLFSRSCLILFAVLFTYQTNR